MPRKRQTTLQQCARAPRANLTDNMAMAETEFVDAEDYCQRLSSTIQRVKHLEENLKKTENQMDNLQK